GADQRGEPLRHRHAAHPPETPPPDGPGRRGRHALTRRTFMTISRPALALAMATAALGGSWLAGYGRSVAQDGPDARSGGAGHVADAMLRPVRLPFGEGKSLEDVAAYLRKELRANVVLDLAALD